MESLCNKVRLHDNWWHNHKALILQCTFSKPIGKMYGHISPILFLAINDRYGHIYTIAFDNCIKVKYPNRAFRCKYFILKVWDITEYTCVISVTSGAHKVLTTVDGQSTVAMCAIGFTLTFSVAYFSQTLQCMVLANEQMAVLKLVPQ